MAELFKTDDEGKVVSIKLGGGQVPGAVVVRGADDRLSWFSPTIPNLIITGISVNGKVKNQFDKTLGNSTFMYVFGDEPVDITIDGMAFASVASAEGCKQLGSNESFHDSYKQFLDYRPTIQDNEGFGLPEVQVKLGTKSTFTGYLVGYNYSLTGVSGTSMLMAKVRYSIKSFNYTDRGR